MYLICLDLGVGMDMTGSGGWNLDHDRGLWVSVDLAWGRGWLWAWMLIMGTLEVG